MSTTETTATGGVKATPTPGQVDRTDQKGSLGQDAFLKLLVAQMQNQDPTSPQDSGQMMSQLASFSQVSQLQQLTAASTALTLGQDFSSAVAMIGKNVTYTKADGTQAAGVVSAVKSDPQGALLQIGSDSIHTGAIVKVQ
jgi:flagellar basal-body rod modification protein FlgD